MKDCAIAVVDMLYDFIDGSLPCRNAADAVEQTVRFIDKLTADTDTDETGIHDIVPVLFICDHHPEGHCSFRQQGGQWPPHCVQGTRGGEIHDSLKPYAQEEFTFYKGEDPSVEQYSGFEAVNDGGQSLSEVLELMDIHSVYVCGIATEYCIRNTCEDLKKGGFNVDVPVSCLGYVDLKGHESALEKMSAEGIRLIRQ